MNRRSIATFFVLGGALIACGDRGLRWEYSIPSALDGSPMRARIRDGGCSGAVRWEQDFVDGETASGPPALPPGVYGVELEVIDEACNVIARGCEEVTLPLGGSSVRVEVSDIAPELGACPGTDAGVDAGTNDAGPIDAAPTDANEMDAGPGVECTTDEDCTCTTDTCVDGWCVPQSRATDLAAGTRHACAIANGSLFCWGSSGVGEVGIAWNTTAATPARIGARSDWTSIEAFDLFSCGLAGGAVWCWGSNYAAQCGVDPAVTENVVNGPRALTLATVPAQLEVGGLQAFVLDASGALTGWGHNGQRQTSGPGLVGDDPVLPQPLGTATWRELSSGTFFTCGIGTDGALSCWGANFSGSLGGAVCTGCEFESITDPPPGPRPNWQHVSLGAEHACAWDDEGTLYCWGRGTMESDGALGGGAPGADTSTATPVSGVVAAEAALNLHTCVVSPSHELWCFGPNRSGQIGVGDTATHYEPARVAGDRWEHIAVGPNYSCATTLEGAVYCWGEGDAHTLGQGFADGGVSGVDAGAVDHHTPSRVCLTGTRRD